MSLASALPFALLYADVNAGPGETGKVAINLATRGQLANPYLVDTGPTAHVSPLHGAVLAAVFRLFGPYGHDARLVLGILAAALYALSAGIAIKTCLALGVRRAVALVAGVTLIALPIHQYDVAVSWRQWDQPWSASFLILGVYLFVKASVPGRRGLLGLGLVAGVGALFSPLVLVTLAIALGIAVWNHRASGNALRSAVAPFLLVGVLLAPWAVRNWLALGSVILTRSNFPLELAVGNYPGAEQMHPFIFLPAAERVAEVGEVTYMREIRERTVGWILANPSEFARLTVARVSSYFFPPPSVAGWMPILGAGIKSVLLAVFGLMTLSSLVLVTWAQRSRSLCWYVFVIVPALPYFVTAVSVRYRYVTFFPSLCLIALAAELAVRRAEGARATQRAPSPGSA